MRASWDAIREIGFTVVSITIVLVIVFLPIALTKTLVSEDVYKRQIYDH